MGSAGTPETDSREGMASTKTKLPLEGSKSSPQILHGDSPVVRKFPAGLKYMLLPKEPPNMLRGLKHAARPEIYAASSQT